MPYDGSISQDKPQLAVGWSSLWALNASRVCMCVCNAIVLLQSLSFAVVVGFHLYEHLYYRAALLCSNAVIGAKSHGNE